MLGALGGVTAVALILVRDEFRPAVIGVWLASALIMWIHEHPGVIA